VRSRRGSTQGRFAILLLRLGEPRLRLRARQIASHFQHTPIAQAPLAGQAEQAEHAQHDKPLVEWPQLGKRLVEWPQHGKRLVEWPQHDKLQVEQVKQAALERALAECRARSVEPLAK